MIEDKDFESVKAEKNELNVLIDKGFKFNIPKFWPLSLSKNKEFTFVIKEPYLGTLDHLSGVSIDLQFNEDDIKEDPWGESKRLAKDHVFKLAKVIAIAYLNNAILIRLFSNLLAFFFKWTVKPSKLYAYATYMNVISNFGDFTNSIRLISASRTTLPTKKANRVEQKD